MEFIRLAFEITPPTSWTGIIGTIAGFGIALGLIVAYFGSREYIKQTIKTLKDTVDSQEQIIQTKEKLAATLAETHSAILAAGEEKLRVMTDERDAYRRDLHATREPMQAMKLKIQEYELRPDLNQVLQKEEKWHTQREAFYTTMAANQQGIIETQRQTLVIIADIKKSVDEELLKSNTICTEVAQALKEVVQKAEHRDARLEILLEQILVELRERRSNENTNTPPTPHAA